jgi:hypothetical protein
MWTFFDSQEATDEMLLEDETYCVQVTAGIRETEVASVEYCFQPRLIGNEHLFCSNKKPALGASDDPHPP